MTNWGLDSSSQAVHIMQQPSGHDERYHLKPLDVDSVQDRTQSNTLKEQRHGIAHRVKASTGCTAR